MPPPDLDPDPQNEVTLLQALAARFGVQARYIDGQTEVVLLRLILGAVTELMLSIEQGGTSITLKTNGNNNAVQSILNLLAGSNVTLTDNGEGGVTIAASGGGSGWLYKTANYDAANGESVIADITDGNWTLKMPPTPTEGASIWFQIINPTDANTLFLDGNGFPISGISSENGVLGLSVFRDGEWYCIEWGRLGGPIPNGVVATTQLPGDNSDKVSTTAYVDAAIAALLADPATLGTLLMAAGITPAPDGVVTPVGAIDTKSGVVTSVS